MGAVQITDGTKVIGAIRTEVHRDRLLTVAIDRSGGGGMAAILDEGELVALIATLQGDLAEIRK
jgi:hypothetical protein